MMPVNFLQRTEPVVFLGSAAIVVAAAGFGSTYPSLLGDIFEAAQSYIVTSFGWLYILTASLMVIFCVWLMFSDVGRIKLGADDSEPEYTTLTWITMLIAAGMGIGLVFFGVAEPMEHYLNPPEVEPETPEAARQGFIYTFFHWGLQPWAIYIAFGMPIAYYHFRHGLPLAPRSLFYPLIGERIYGIAGHIVDILCTVGTLLGVATSLGLGAMQINAGLEALAGVGRSTMAQVTIIVVITAVATVSVVTGVKGGIRRLSQINLGLAGVILVFVLVTGPTIYLLELFLTSLGNYLQELPAISLRIDPRVNHEWRADWTLFYWAWWISWSPFVGVFIACISRGRTIREFAFVSLFVPSLLGFFWFSVMGGTGLFIELYGNGGVAEATAEDNSLALYKVLENLPLPTIMAGLVTLLIVIFFVTSSDSGSLVDDLVTSGGNPNPPKATRVFWAVSEGAVAITLLLAGGLSALRNAALMTGLPLSLILLLSAFALMRALRVDMASKGTPKTRKLYGSK